MENTEKSLALIEQEEIKVAVANSGLDLQKALSHAFEFVPSMKEINELTKAMEGMNKENPSPEDVKLARENRLKLVKVRTGAKGKKEELKDTIITEGKFIDKLYNTVVATANLSEEEFEVIEKHYENIEKQKKEALQKQRADLLMEYADPAPFPLGEMTEENFNNLLEGMKLQKQKKDDEAKKAEEERIAREKAEEEERQRIKEENERLRKENEEKERILEEERKIKEQELAKVEAEKKKLQEKAEKEKKEQQRKLDEERAKVEAVQAEIKRIEEERLKAEKEKKEAEEKAEKERIAAEKKAAKAPDKTKLKNFVASFEVPNQPSGLGEDALIIESQIIEKFKGFKSWAEGLIEKM